MLKVGDFSKIAQVSIRLLRYYDEVGLFHPEYVDPDSGYRYYRVEQLTELNKILALKDFGLTLDQIQRYLRDNLSPEDIQGMLLLHRAQVEQQVMEEMARLKRIEYRIKQLKGGDTVYDVVIKSTSAFNFLSTRRRALLQADWGQYMFGLFHALETNNITPGGTFTMLEHSPEYPENIYDLEIGFITPIAQIPDTRAITTTHQYDLSYRTLEPVEQMATLMHIGAWGTGVHGYHALGRWVQENNYEFAGAIREVYQKLAPYPPQPGQNVVEFQLPVRPLQRRF
ncbi:MAG: MerR family transcriptional regulator [Aggregatilineales bacterium]